MSAPDPVAILRALGWAASAPPAPVSGGADTLIWRVQTPQGERALRVFRPEQAPVAAFEARVMGFLSARGYPVPVVRAQGACAGSPALLMDWVDGHTAEMTLDRWPELAVPLGLAFGRVQAQLHALDLPEDLLRWAREAVGMLTVPAVPAPERSALLHLDYHLLNVLFAPPERAVRVSGVIDWANLRLGDPRADVARSLSILSVYPTVWQLSGPARAGLLRFRRAYLWGYQELAGPLADLAPFLAWAGTWMLTDLRGRFGAPEEATISRWVARWQARL